MPKTKLIEFSMERGGTSREVSTVSGKPIAILTHVLTVFPASVTRADIDAFVTNAKQDDPDDPDSDWVVELPGLEKVSWCERESLAEEVANALNENGVSVSDWPVYNLDPG